MIKTLIVIFTCGIAALCIVGQVQSIKALIADKSKVWMLGFIASTVTFFAAVITGCLLYKGL